MSRLSEEVLDLLKDLHGEIEAQPDHNASLLQRVDDLLVAEGVWDAKPMATERLLG